MLSKSVGGGSLEERIREDREGSVYNLTTLFLPASAHSSVIIHIHSRPPPSLPLHYYPDAAPPNPGVKVSLRKLLTDVMIQSAQIFPLSFSCSGSEETDRANIHIKKRRDTHTKLTKLITESLKSFWFVLCCDVMEHCSSTHHKMQSQSQLALPVS